MSNSRQRQVQKILGLYAAGERNFQSLNLSALVLAGQDLSQADFSGCNIRGTDFTGAQLTHARFCGAQAGLLPRWRPILRLVTFFLGLLAGFLSTQIAVAVVSSDWINRLAGLISLLLLTFFGQVSKASGLLRAAVTTAALLCVLGTLTGCLSVGLAQHDLGYTMLEVAQMTVLEIAVTTTLYLAISLPQMGVGNIRFLAALGSTIGTLAVALFASGYIAENIGIAGTILSVIVGNLLIQHCISVAKQAITADPNHALIRSFAVAMTAQLGTRFSNANLMGAHFAQAQLAHTDLRAAELDYTRWDGASGLGFVCWGAQPMADPMIRALFITRCAPEDASEDVPDVKQSRRHLAGVDLAYTDLSGMDLRQANLKGASLIGANLRGANLTDSNLTLLQAFGTDFTNAHMTGVCIEGWSINETTCLESVTCAYVYRLEQQPICGPDDRHRLPSSGEFEPGDFTRLFQAVLNTVDFVFRQGVNREALAAALQTVQHSYDPAIKLQAIEDRGNGFFKVALGVPDAISKADFHQDLTQIYQANLAQIEARYQTLLQTQQQQLTHYQQTTTTLTTILKQLTEVTRPMVSDCAEPTDPAIASARSVILTFWDGSLEQGFPVTADIRVDSKTAPLKFHASLPPAPELAINYQQWQTLYRQVFSSCSRIQFDSPDETTNVSRQELDILANRLAANLQDWLQSPNFRLIADKLREKFLPDQTIRVIVQTEDIWLRRLPWHLWQFLDDYPRADVTLSGMTLEMASCEHHLRSQTRVLAVMGNSVGIDIDVDQRLLRGFGAANVDVVCLSEPNRQQFHEALWEPQGWDVLYFSGHSYSQMDGQSGTMQLNPQEKISVEDLQVALKRAVNLGLQLVILNSCDGLGLAKALCTLKIPQVVVMKEPVPDQVAQRFLDYFLQALEQDANFYTAFHDARQQLSGLEDKYPFASWLPTLFQTAFTVLHPTALPASPSQKTLA
ncbi:MAG: pentapeptide repeat-containing protein [Cyanobacteria bacterium J06631_9]